ncbi:non-heme iron oxygenase ferredoxin subunit [Roseomonas nepalensis]|uniref:Non-heme iron oxygenase ferredoxin subunit n=1 Tax=Muricoccus nepalensis TaxID=1854500 RepID=A0A502F6L3_9PROT|nr:non-heme iron oxygenase ferredoxin subunit [Roseomonas nepalensis]TPG44919.1 non-heme iron oxygenase ferredoxin subunit [Roseomonas nepalensis]
MTLEDELQALCDTTAVEGDTPVRAELAGEAYAVFLVDGAYYVTQDLCTHGPGSLAEGFVEGGEIECPFHQGKFDIRTGEPTAPPCTEALRTWDARVVEGKVCIDPAQVRKSV